MTITFIQTGGTIDKDYPKLTKGYAFEISEPAVKRILAEVSPNFKFKVVSVLKKDSQEITNQDRRKILEVCRKFSSNKIVITHGTDTMIQTAKFLAKNIKNKTIVLTGSMRPEKFADSDASFNVGVAVGALNVLTSGVYVSMNGRLYQADAVKRNLKTGQFVEIK
jgi:L-asparaginase